MSFEYPSICVTEYVFLLLAKMPIKMMGGFICSSELINYKMSMQSVSGFLLSFKTKIYPNIIGQMSH